MVEFWKWRKDWLKKINFEKRGEENEKYGKRRMRKWLIVMDMGIEEWREEK